GRQAFFLVLVYIGNRFYECPEHAQDYLTVTLSEFLGGIDGIVSPNDSGVLEARNRIEVEFARRHRQRRLDHRRVDDAGFQCGETRGLIAEAEDGRFLFWINAHVSQSNS